jgi:hypothetical protein
MKKDHEVPSENPNERLQPLYKKVEQQEPHIASVFPETFAATKAMPPESAVVIKEQLDDDLQVVRTDTAGQLENARTEMNIADEEVNQQADT